MASRRSLIALDALNVFLADVRDGIGPYLSVYLKSRHWESGRIGLIMSTATLAGVVAQTPVGGFVDATKKKRGMVAFASLLVGAAALVMIARPTFPVIVSAQVAMGLAGAIFGPAVAAITLGLVGQAKFSRRLGRNEGFNHAGNVLAAALAGLIGVTIAYEGIFVLLAAMAAISVVCVFSIRRSEIDDEVARGAIDKSAGPGPNETQPKIQGFREIFTNKQLGLFVVSAVLFHFANAAMLPLAGQKVEASQGEGALSMSACVIAAQLVMVPVSVISGRLAETLGRKPVFLVAFAILPVRGFLYTLGSSPAWIVGVQLLDGVGAGIFGVLAVMMIADLTRGTGRFNLVRGALETAAGLGASVSHTCAGYITQAKGFNAGFLFLAAVALIALAFFAFLVKETKPKDQFEAGSGLEEKTGTGDDR